MSNDQAKHADLIVNWAFKAIIALAVGACSLVFTSMRGDVIYLMQKSGQAEIRLMRIETQLEDRASNEMRRDKAIEEIQRTLNERRK